MHDQVLGLSLVRRTDEPDQHGVLAQANTQASALADSKSGWFSDWSKEDKALALNLGVGAAGTRSAPLP